MLANDLSRPIPTDKCSCKLELAILSVLVHYNGRYEESLLDWHLALKLAVPSLPHPEQLLEVFRSLSRRQLISLEEPRGSADTISPLERPFTAVLTSDGLLYWNAVHSPSTIVAAAAVRPVMRVNGRGHATLLN